MEAEFVALTECAKELVWLKNVMDGLREIGAAVDNTRLYSDSMSAIHYASNKSERSRTKHIDVRLHYIRELIEKNIVELSHVCGKRNPADYFTKAVPKEKLANFISLYFN